MTDIYKKVYFVSWDVVSVLGEMQDYLKENCLNDGDWVDRINIEKDSSSYTGVIYELLDKHEINKIEVLCEKNE